MIGGKVMNLVRFNNPYRTVNQNLVDQLFNNFLRNDYHENHSGNCNFKPATNIFETGQDFKLEMLLPGFKKEDVQLNFHENVLTVKVELQEKEENQNQEYKYEHREFNVYSFERKFKVPETVNPDNIAARFENGILELVLPKKEEALPKPPVEIKIK
jgi:HSP20 family protein